MFPLCYTLDLQTLLFMLYIYRIFLHSAFRNSDKLKKETNLAIFAVYLFYLFNI